MIRAGKNIKIIFKYVIAPLLGAWLFYSLYKQIKEQPHLQESINLIKQAPFGAQAWKFWIVILLVFVNWGFESKKWQVLLQTIQPVSFFTAYKSVLSGITLSLNMPNRIGEYGGRILYVNEGKRIKAISLSIAGSISQLIITLVIGCGGLIYLIFFQQNTSGAIMGLSLFWIKTLLYLSSFFSIITVLFYFRLSWLIKLVEKIPAAAKYVEYIDVLEDFNAKLLLRLLYHFFVTIHCFRHTVYITVAGFRCSCFMVKWLLDYKYSFSCAGYCAIFCHCRFRHQRKIQYAAFELIQCKYNRNNWNHIWYMVHQFIHSCFRRKPANIGY